MSRAMQTLFAMLYVAFAALANPVTAAPLDRQTMLDLRQGEMRKLDVYRIPIDLPVYGLLDMNENDRSLDEFKGKYVLLNFWATWCAPCRKEMPSLNALQQDLGSDTFAVVPIATGRNPVPAIKKFFGEEEISTLETLRDPSQQLGSIMGIFGLPVTLILNPQGQEIARMRGDADWHSQDAVAYLKAVIAGTDD